MTFRFSRLFGSAGLCLGMMTGLPAMADNHDCTDFETEWPSMTDAVYAACAAQAGAFDADPAKRATFAWQIFARANVATTDPDGNQIPRWMTWPQNSQTFGGKTATACSYDGPNDGKTRDFVVAKDQLAKGLTDDPDIPPSSGEEVTRNLDSYGYICERDQPLVSRAGFSYYFENSGLDRIEMPIGTVETKARWATADEVASTTGAYSPNPDADTPLYLAGIHLMVKMANASGDLFTTPEPTWFWVTMEFNGNKGIENLRSITSYGGAQYQLENDQIVDILSQGGANPEQFSNYAPNGTQLSFVENNTSVILGHSMMEEFAGYNSAGFTPAAGVASWSGFASSCHSCHATAAFDPVKKTAIAMPFVIGNLPKSLIDALEGYKSLDFMWPFIFETDLRKHQVNPAK